MDLFITRRGGGGGGGDLNFSVTGGTTQPVNPAENIIWVNTDAEIGTWTISGKAPESPEDGDVWFRLAATGNEIEALTENSFLFAILSAKQYLDGTWTDVDAQIYRNGSWESALSVYVIFDGTWNGVGGLTATAPNNTKVYNEQNPVVAEVSGGTSSGTLYLQIDVTGYTALEVEFEFRSPQWCYVTVSSDTNYYDGKATNCIAYAHFLGGVDRTVARLPLNGAMGKYYFKVYCWSGGTFKLYSLKLI